MSDSSSEEGSKDDKGSWCRQRSWSSNASKFYKNDEDYSDDYNQEHFDWTREEEQWKWFR